MITTKQLEEFDNDFAEAVSTTIPTADAASTQFSLKNFRVFDHKQGATFNLAPLTILTGCNSSGKSSVVKAILLLRDFFEQMLTQNIADCKLDFGNKLAKLGSYDIARNCNSRKGSKMTFAYTVRPDNMDKDFRVQLTFGTEKEDTLNNGFLTSAIITDITSGDTVFEIEKVEDRYEVKVLNMNPVTIDFMRYLLWKVTIYTALETDPTGEKVDNNGEHLQYYTKEDLKDINEALEVSAPFFYEKEYENLSKKVNNILKDFHQPRAYYLVPRQVISAAKTGLLFSLPILEETYSLPKSEVRDFIIKRLEERMEEEKKTQNPRSLSWDKEKFEELISDFESSKHNTLGEYFNEKEVAFLNHINPKDSAQICIPDSRIKELSGYEIGRLTRMESGWHWNEEESFQDLYYKIRALKELSNIKEYEYTLDDLIKVSPEVDNKEYDLYVRLRHFYIDAVMQSLLPKKLCNFEYVGDSTITLQRLYNTESNDEFGKALFRYLEACRTNEWRDINAGDFVNKWVKKFGFGDHISISLTAEGLGLIVKLHKSEDDKHGRLLADEGFGITALIGTMLKIETAILTAKKKPTGYYTTLDRQRYPKKARMVTTIAIEEPENHLHPRYQALLAEMFADAYKNYNIHFIVETHSEYMVRKLQTLVAKKELTPEEVSLQYVYNADAEKRPKGEPHVKNIEIREDGILRDSFGPGFFDEADNLAMDLLK